MKTASLIGRNHPDSKLIVIRGNSGSGKTSIASSIRDHYGRGLAVIGQDNLRRVVLYDRHREGAANIGLIDLTARYALENGFDVLIEGILLAEYYADMLLALARDHIGTSCFYFLDIPWDETLKRHAAKNATFGEKEMAVWFRDQDLLPGGVEHVIGEDSALTDSVNRILIDAEIQAEHAAASGRAM